MKKLLIALLTFIPVTVFAECTTVDEIDLRAKVNSVTIKYEHPGDNIFNIIFNGLETDFYAEEISKEMVIKKNENEKASGYEGGDSYIVSYYGAEDSACPNILLRVQTIIIPRYNSLSEKEECETYPEFSLCDKWYPAEVSDIGFYEQLNNYKIKIKNDEIEEANKVVEEESWFLKIFNKIAAFFTKEILYAILAAAVLALGIWLSVFLKRKKANRI